MQAQAAAQNIAGAQDLAQRGIKGAAASTLTAEQKAQQESAQAKTVGDMATQAAERQRSDIGTQAAAALTAGDYAGYNKMMQQLGAPGVDFTNKNSMDVANDLLNTAQTLAQSNPTLAAALTTQAEQLKGSVYKALTGTTIDPAALSTAISSIGSAQYQTPEAQALVGKSGVLDSTLSWYESPDAAGFRMQVENNPTVQAIDKRIASNAATPEDYTTLGNIIGLGLAAQNPNGLSADLQQMAKDYKLDLSKVSSTTQTSVAEDLLKTPPTDWGKALTDAGGANGDVYKTLLATTQVPDASTAEVHDSGTTTRSSTLDTALNNCTLVKYNGILYNVTGTKSGSKHGGAYGWWGGGGLGSKMATVYVLTNPLSGVTVEAEAAGGKTPRINMNF
jgi:hypothetical protein